MKPIYIKDQQHAALKAYAKANGLKLEFIAEIMASNFLESLQNETKRPQKKAVEPVQLVNVLHPEQVVKIDLPNELQTKLQTVEVVTPQKVESPTKGMTLFVNSPYFDIDLLTEKINEQPRFKRFMPIDVQKLYDTMYSWSESNFEKRKDWLSVAFTFLSKAKGGEFKPTINGITLTKRDQEIINWMNS
jgi:hypothetical protein